MYLSVKSCCSLGLNVFQIPFDACKASMMFSRTVKSGMIPVTLRSSAINANFAFTALRGDQNNDDNGLSCIFSWPESRDSTPNSSCATSERPAPSSPANPTCSPLRTWNETGCTMPRRPKSVTSKMTSPPSAVSRFTAACGVFSARLLPSIFATISTRLSSAVLYVPTFWPSRKIVMRSLTAYT